MKPYRTRNPKAPKPPYDGVPKTTIMRDKSISLGLTDEALIQEVPSGMCPSRPSLDIDANLLGMV